MVSVFIYIYFFYKQDVDISIKKKILKCSATQIAAE